MTEDTTRHPHSTKLIDPTRSPTMMRDLLPASNIFAPSSRRPCSQSYGTIIGPVTRTSWVLGEDHLPDWDEERIPDTVTRKKEEDTLPAGERSILLFASFLKGGLCGVYVPFISLWFHTNGFSSSQVGVLSACDLLVSMLLVPVYGAVLDRFRCHNIGLSVTMVAVGILKLLYLKCGREFSAVYVLLSAFTAPLLKGANAVLDGQCLYALGGSSEFGQIRAFGSIGFGCFALVVGLLVNSGATMRETKNEVGVKKIIAFVEVHDPGRIVSGETKTTQITPAPVVDTVVDHMDNYAKMDWVLYFFAGISFLAAGYWLVMHRRVKSIKPDRGWERENVDSDGTEKSWYAQVKVGASVLYGRGKLFRYLSALLCLGMMMGIIGTYEFIMLTKMHTPVHFMGFCRFVGTSLELPLWFWGVRIMDTIGLETLQVVCLFGNSFRLWGYGQITEYHHALYFEVCHGFTFALPYLSIVVHLSRSMPEEVKATMTSCCLTIFLGCGSGLGAVLGGVLVDRFLDGNVQALFRLAATGCFVLGVVFCVWDSVVWQRRTDIYSRPRSLPG